MTDTTTIDPFAVELGAVPLERIESELATLSAHLAAVECRWLLLLAEFDRREGYTTWGCHSAVQWMNWRLGIGRRAAYEKLRVARRVAELPVIAEAFGRGELSYSKVRAVTRIATPETEAGLVEWCRHGTAAHIERIAAAKRRADAATSPAARREQHAERHVAVRYRDGGGRAIFDGPPEAVAVIERFVTHVFDHVERQVADARSSSEGDGAPGVCSAEHTDVLALAADWDEVPLAAKRFDAFVHLATNGLEALADRQPAGDDRYLVNVHVDFDALAGDGEGDCYLEDGHDVSAQVVHRMLCGNSVVLHVDDADGNPLWQGRKSRRPNRAQQRAVRARDKTCRFPGCDRKIVEIHHGDEWGSLGETNIDRLLSLCSFHHHLCHEGGFVARIVDGDVEFRRPDGVLIGVEPLRAPPETLEPAFVAGQLGLDLGPEANRCRWDGSPPDYQLCIDALVSLERLAVPLQSRTTTSMVQ